MQYDMISADGHVDLIWLPPDLFTANASAPMRDRMPYVEQGPAGPRWVSRNGAQFGRYCRANGVCADFGRNRHWRCFLQQEYHY